METLTELVSLILDMFPQTVLYQESKGHQIAPVLVQFL